MTTMVHSLLHCVVGRPEPCPGRATISLIASADVRHHKWWADGQPGIFCSVFLLSDLRRNAGYRYDTLSGGKSNFRGKDSHHLNSFRGCGKIFEKWQALQTSCVFEGRSKQVVA